MNFDQAQFVQETLDLASTHQKSLGRWDRGFTTDLYEKWVELGASMIWSGKMLRQLSRIEDLLIGGDVD